MGIQELEYSGWFGCSKITLPYPPSVLVVAITAEAEDGSDTVVDPSSYDLCGQTVIVSPGAEWVRLAKHRITYRAGYGRLEGDPAGWVNDGVPEPVRVAIMMLVAQWYRTREPVAVGAGVAELPFSVEALLSPYIVYDNG